MSAIPIKRGDGYALSGHMEYQLLTEADLGSLPGTNVAAVGSYAYLSDYSKIWVLGEDNMWRLVASITNSDQMGELTEKYNALLEILQQVSEALKNGNTEGAINILDSIQLD